MERILTTAQMREADLVTIERLGVASEVLVERAGSAVAKEIITRFAGGRVLVCIGKGNNGEDGKVIAQLLSKRHGFNVLTVNVNNGIFKVFDNQFDIIVDCIFGTGLNKTVEGKFEKCINLINKSNAFVVSCDIPSGLNGDTGLAMGVAVKANLTVAIQELKLGHFINDGPDYCGEVVAKDIGISIWGEDYITRITNSIAKKYFPVRNRNVNKGCFGKACILGGSKSFPGSVLLSYNALTALKMGLGYSNLAVPESLFNSLLTVSPECTMTILKEKDGFIDYCESSLEKLLKYDCIALGMGLGVSQAVYKTLCFLLEKYSGKLVLDADALNSLAKFGVDVLKNVKCKVVITPHVLEFARLLNIDKEKVITNSISLAKSFANEYNVVVLLKSATSIITDGNHVVLNTTGCSGMAKGGSGDVLSGIMSGVLTRADDFFEGVCVAPYVFGLAGEIAQKEQNEYTITASDIIKALPKAIDKIRD